MKEIQVTFQVCLLKTANFQSNGNFKTKDKLSIHSYLKSVSPLPKSCLCTYMHDLPEVEGQWEM